MDRRAALGMAEELLEEHGLAGWRVQLDSAKRRAGVCRFTDRVIGLSGPITELHSEAEVIDTTRLTPDEAARRIADAVNG